MPNIKQHTSVDKDTHLNHSDTLLQQLLITHKKTTEEDAANTGTAQACLHNTCLALVSTAVTNARQQEAAAVKRYTPAAALAAHTPTAVEYSHCVTQRLRTPPCLCLHCCCCCCASPSFEQPCTPPEGLDGDCSQASPRAAERRAAAPLPCEGVISFHHGTGL